MLTVVRVVRLLISRDKEGKKEWGWLLVFGLNRIEPNPEDEWQGKGGNNAFPLLKESVFREHTANGDSQ